MSEVEPAIARAPARSEIGKAAVIGQIAFQSTELEPWTNSYNWIADNLGLDYLIVVDVDGELVASLLCTPGSARFGDDVVPLSAVGGVATLPAHRQHGYAALMMERAVKVLYEAGYHTSALWPFSYNYYRKFGWEIGSEHRMYSVPSDLAKTLGLPGSTRPAIREDLPSISRLVDRFAKGHNCVSVRDELWWSCISSTYGFKFDGNCDVRASRCPWVHETDGEIDGYCVFGLSGEGEQTFVDVKEIIVDTSRARNAILSRLSQAGAPKINFCAPIDDGFLQELPNPRLVKTEIQAGFQFRVINPPGALELRSVDPSLEGRIGFHVIDPVLPAFEFDVEVSAGRISRAKGRASERLSMSVQTFSQLYTGYISPLRAAELGRIDATSGGAVIFADRLFPKRIPFRSFIELG